MPITPSTSDPLPPLGEDALDALRADIVVRGIQTAVEVCAVSGEILDGRARVQIAEALGLSRYPRRIVGNLTTQEQRRHHRIKANCLRRQLERPAVKAAVLTELRLSASSDRAAAAMFAVSHTCVSNWRRVWESTGKLLPGGTRKGKDGKTYYKPSSMYATTRADARRASGFLAELGPDAEGKHLNNREASNQVFRKRKRSAPDAPEPRDVKLIHGRFQDAIIASG